MSAYGKNKIDGKAYGFDDVAIKPRSSTIRAHDVDLTSPLTRNINIHVPFISAGMTSVTSVDMAIAMAESGSVGVLPRLHDFDQQLKQVDLVKKKVRSLIRDPVSILPGATVAEAQQMLKDNNLPVLIVIDSQSRKMTGLITPAILAQVSEHQTMRIIEIMDKPDDVKVKVGMSEKHYREIFAQYDSAFLVLENDHGQCQGLLLRDDIEFALDSTGATKDGHGSLLCASTVSFGEEEVGRAEQLINAGANIIVVHAPNGHLRHFVETVTRIRRLSTDRSFDVIAGNVTDPSAARKLVEAGADAIKVGIGASSAAKTEALTGVSMPQISAIMAVYEECQMHHVPVIADGGIRHSGDAVKALAAGASAVMLGGLLAGVQESPAEIYDYDGKQWKKYLPELNATDPDHIIDTGQGRYVPLEGSLKDKLIELSNNLKLAMEYVGVGTLEALRSDASFVEKTAN